MYVRVIKKYPKVDHYSYRLYFSILLCQGNKMYSCSLSVIVFTLFLIPFQYIPTNNYSKV